MKELMPFQLFGVDFLKKHSHALLADEMGLGKSAQAIVASLKIQATKILVICPASVRSSWQQEIVDWGQNPDRFTVMSYNEVVAVYEKLTPNDRWDLLIIDEAHFCKTPESQRTQAVFGPRGVARSSSIIWALSGTPLLNRPVELYPLLATLAADKIAPYNSYTAFTQKFCGAHFDGRGINVKGASNLADLRQRLEGRFMLRRTVDEVLPDLPPVSITRPALELTAKEMAPVSEIENEILDREAFLSSVKEDYAGLGDLARIRKAVGMAKAKKIAAYVEDLIEIGGSENTKVVIFYWHTAVADLLDQELGHYLPVRYCGGMTDKAKDAAKKTFITDKDCNVFLGQIAASGTGINGLQTASSIMVFAEIDWSPEVMKQNMARLRRIGMDMNKPVFCHIPHVPGTIESAVLSVNIRKEEVIGKLMGPVVDESGIKLLGDLW